MYLLLEIRIFLKTIQIVLSCLPAGRSAKAAANPTSKTKLNKIVLTEMINSTIIPHKILTFVGK